MSATSSTTSTRIESSRADEEDGAAILSVGVDSHPSRIASTASSTTIDLGTLNNDHVCTDFPVEGAAVRCRWIARRRAVT